MRKQQRSRSGFDLQVADCTNNDVVVPSFINPLQVTIDPRDHILDDRGSVLREVILKPLEFIRLLRCEPLANVKLLVAQHVNAELTDAGDLRPTGRTTVWQKRNQGRIQ